MVRRDQSRSTLSQRGLVRALCALTCAFAGPAYRATAQNDAAPAATVSVWSGVYTDEQARRGNELYRRECSSCHADDLNGVEYAPPLTVDFLVSQWGLGVRTVGELFNRVVTSMPLDKPGSLSPQAYADILTHILKMNGFPAGAQELSRDATVLGRIGLSVEPPK
jgi:hypothetical protein